MRAASTIAAIISGGCHHHRDGFGRARGSRNDSSKVTQKPLGPGSIEKTVFLIHA
jgi:hypothetical protein